MSDAPQLIDVKVQGQERVTGIVLIEGGSTALIDTGPYTSLRTVMTALEAAGVDHLDWIVLTHIHLDHAGAAGTMVKAFPGCRIAVHAVGAPHLVDPSRLWSSASRIYGAEMENLWGRIDPVPEDRLHMVSDGDQINLGSRTLQVVETTGHAEHHHAYLDDETGTLFAGDAVGVRLPDLGVARPASPPPEFDAAKARASIRKIGDMSPVDIWLSHYGSVQAGVKAKTPPDALEAADQAIGRWADWIAPLHADGRTVEEIAVDVEVLELEVEKKSMTSSQRSRMEAASSCWMSTWGFCRHFERLTS